MQSSIKGIRCPSCRSESLFVNSVGSLTCSVIGCKNPAAIMDMHNPAPKPAPIPMLIYCPECSERHLDVGEFATKPHHTHACQYCGETWRPAVVYTIGVKFLPGFKNGAEEHVRATTEWEG
jgi:transposase-like protein